jgi:hypothetical protein
MSEARREAVQPVGEVHRVARGGDDEVGEQRRSRRAEPGGGVVADEGQVRRGRGQPGVVAELQGRDGEADADDELADELRRGVEPERALLADLDEVVEEADEPEPGHEPEHQQAARRRTGAGLPDHEQVRHAVADERRRR